MELKGFREGVHRHHRFFDNWLFATALDRRGSLDWSHTVPNLEHLLMVVTLPGSDLI